MNLLIITQKIHKDDDNLGFFHRWVEEFAKHASSVTVIASTIGTYKFPANVEVYSLGKEKGAGKLSRLWKFWELFFYHYVRADAVFFHMIPEFALMSAPFLLLSRKRIALWYVHKSVTWKLKLAERIVDYVFTASEFSFRLPSKKVIYTGHAIDTDFFVPGNSFNVSGQALRMLTVGRISPVKDYETVIRACKILKDSWPRSWTLSIVGGPLMERDKEYLLLLKKQVAELGLLRHIVFQGPRPYTEVVSLYHDHDIFISMSTTGSIDKAVLEAMSCGLTTITSNEAFLSILKPPYFLERRGAELLAERIKLLADENRPNAALRNSVAREHSLKNTISRISGILANGI